MAPIFVKNHSWTQTEDTVNILVPMKAALRKDMDVFTCSTYVKINAPPFLFELFLYAEIDEERSKCSFAANHIIIDLFKVEAKDWPQLAADITKEDKILMRQKIVDRKHKQVAEQSKERSKKLYELNQFAIQKQIGLGSAYRQKVEDLKNDERKKVNRELEKWKRDSEEHVQDGIHFLKGSADNGKNEMEEFIEERPQISHEEPIVEVAETKRYREEVQALPSISEKLQTNRSSAVIDHSNFPIPLPRPRGKIQVSFSAREFPTPTRESKLQEEQEWLKKQFDARKAAGFVAEDLRPEECDPVWLKDKGDTFYGHNNFLGAISAYSHAIKIGSKMPGLFSNRAAAHFQLGNLHKALEDCSMALELLTPHVTANEEARFTCHVRRAAILWRLGVPDKALPDYEAALKLRPSDDEVRDDYNRAKAMADEEESD